MTSTSSTQLDLISLIKSNLSDLLPYFEYQRKHQLVQRASKKEDLFRSIFSWSFVAKTQYLVLFSTLKETLSTS